MRRCGAGVHACAGVILNTFNFVSAASRRAE
jgi:hypothetical protein